MTAIGDARTERRGRPPNRGRRESGQAVAETALVGLLLLSLLVAGIDFGRYMYDGILLGNGARAGVQYGAQNLTTADDDAGMESAATTDADSLAGSSATATQYCVCGGTQFTCTSSEPSSCSTSPRLVYVSVTATGTFTPWIAFPGIASSTTISRTAVMQVSP